MTVRYTRRNIDHSSIRTRAGPFAIRKCRLVWIFAIGAFLGMTIALFQRWVTKRPRNSAHPLQQGLSNATFSTVIIVLGEILVNGTKPSENLKSRIHAAQNVLEEVAGKNKDMIHVIFSGGDTARVNKTEAKVMKELWEERYESRGGNKYDGSKRIEFHLEHQSMSTCQNAFYSFPILHKIRQKHWPHPLYTVLVTSDYHVARAQLLFEQVFQTELQPQNDSIFQIDNVMGAPTIDKDLRKQLFQNERYWLQPKNLEKLLYQMEDHPFQLPTTARIQQAIVELDRRE